MCGCAPSEHLDLQSSKANVVLFCCLFFLLLLELVVHGHRPKIYTEINIFKYVTEFLVVQVVLFLCIFFSSIC